MANKRSIKAYYSNDRKYFENSLGSEFNYTSATGPYEYLLGALAGCYSSTLCSLERKSNWKALELEVSGIKREKIPTTLESTAIKIIAKGVEDKSEFEYLTKKASEDCSIFQTIAKVSKMRIEIEYED